MDLVGLFVGLRRLARRAGPLVVVAMLAVGVLLDAIEPSEGLFGTLATMIAVLVVARAWRRTQAVDHPRLRDVEVGGLVVLGALAVAVHSDRLLSGPTHPLVYVAVGLVSAFAHPLATVLVVAATLGLEALLQEVAFGGLVVSEIGTHAAFMGAIAATNLMSLRLEIARLRKASRTELSAERDRIREEARNYRLLRPVADDEPEGGREDERLFRSVVEEIQLSVLFALRLLRECLDAHTAILLWVNERGSHLRVSELVSDAEDHELCDGPFSAGDGIVGAVLSQRAPVSLTDLKPSHHLPYYADACPVQAVCGVPVFERGQLRGVLIVDRREAHPFRPEEEELCEQAARFAARAIENERVFVQLERTRVEQSKLYRAAERLGAAISEQEVVEAGVSSASDIAAVDFAAFTSFEPKDESHQIRAVRGDAKARLEGRRFASNTGLVTMALRNRHPLPYRGEYDPSHQLVFARDLSAPEMPSLLVLPLVVHDEPLGTLVLGSKRPQAFDDAARSLLDVLASHLAVSLSNARMVRRLEEQATTDGLTGLLNKRAMLEMAEQKLSAARRFGRPLSVLVCDIDHFKRVNDTYGHDVGDVVIKALGQVHHREKRTTDAVARFGGEEFVTICEQTDAEGALLLAERIREEFKRTTFHANGEEVHCTCSVGVATFPGVGKSWDELFKAADEALYASKRGGRDRATIWEPRLREHGAA
ncbi:MAG: diguanylate cyclase [Deltaproteobacteria bacterium]|nr:diguanylate cyclase [Deltaproteobacteria bacterium]